MLMAIRSSSARNRIIKPLENFVYQYKHAGLYLDRREAIEYCAEHQDEALAQALLKQA